MDKLPWFPFYAGEFLNDPKVMAMTNEQVGIYTKLLALQWREGSIPDDMEKLGRMVGLQSNRNATVLPAVCECFTVASEGTLRNRRMEEVRQEQLGKLDQKSAAGKVGAKARWNKDLDAAALPPQSARNGETMQEEDKEEDLEVLLQNNTPTEVGSEDEKPETEKSKPTVGPPTFEKFWRTIPKECKGSKVQALRQWKAKAIDIRGELFLDHLIESHAKQYRYYQAEKRKTGWGARPQDIIRWLRDERWEDETPDAGSQATDAERTPGRHDDVVR